MIGVLMSSEVERIETEAKMANFLSRHMPEVNEENHEKPKKSQYQIKSTLNSIATFSDLVGSAFGNNINSTPPPEHMLLSVTQI
jgi:hypothetical protein